MREFLLQKCLENGIVAANPMSECDMAVFSNPDVSDRTLRKQILRIYLWDEVSSLEWPIVIYASYNEETFELHYHEYAKYRACSRSTGKLIQITAVKNDTYEIRKSFFKQQRSVSESELKGKAYF